MGGYNGETGAPTKAVERLDLRDNGSLNIEEQFEIEKYLGAVDCCVIRTNKYNEHLLPLASYLDHWIVW